MKKGDKVWCKNSLTHIHYQEPPLTSNFIKDNFYTIYKINEYGGFFILTKHNNVDTKNQGVWFSNDGYYYPFDKYFYTEKEIRKMKLEKLNGILI